MHKTYIRTTIDRVTTPDLQDRMIENWQVDEVHNLVSGHFPAFSVPQKLAELMLYEALHGILIKGQWVTTPFFIVTHAEPWMNAELSLCSRDLRGDAALSTGDGGLLLAEFRVSQG